MSSKAKPIVAETKLPETLLSIIIPEYKPDLLRLQQNLFSISSQLNVDLHQVLVILINDSDGEPLSTN